MTECGVALQGYGDGDQTGKSRRWRISPTFLASDEPALNQFPHSTPLLVASATVRTLTYLCVCVGSTHPHSDPNGRRLVQLKFRLPASKLSFNFSVGGADGWTQKSRTTILNTQWRLPNGGPRSAAGRLTTTQMNTCFTRWGADWRWLQSQPVATGSAQQQMLKWHKKVMIKPGWRHVLCSHTRVTQRLVRSAVASQREGLWFESQLDLSVQSLHVPTGAFSGYSGSSHSPKIDNRRLNFIVKPVCNLQWFGDFWFSVF